MALQKRRYADIPPDAIVLSEDEALKYQGKILKGWKNRSDVFGYNYGSFVLAGGSFFTAFVINGHFRNKFKLLHYGRAASFLPVCFIPAVFSGLTHLEFVLKDVVLQKRDTCPVCLEMRASAIQAMVGGVFPLILAPIANLSLVHKYGTYNVPDIIHQPRQLFSLLRAKAAPVTNLLFALFIGQALLGAGVTYWESSSVLKVGSKLAQLEKQLEESGV